MQTINKSLVKNTFTYTWFLYPISAVLLSLIWLWSFPLAHQPKAREKIELYCSAEVNNEEFTDQILAKYDRNKLRTINLEYPIPFTRTSSTTELFNRCDMMILNQDTFHQYTTLYSGVFAEINSFIQESLQIDNSRVVEEHGIILKESGETCYLSNYINFTSGNTYVLAFLAKSKNLGAAFNENNAKYDNALTVAHYLIEGVE